MTTITELAECIALHSSALSRCFDDAGLLEPTLSGIGDSTFPSLDGNGDEIRTQLLSALTQLGRLVAGPFESLFNLSTATFDIGILQTLIQFNVPRSVPLNRPISYTDLAKRTGLREDPLKHLVRSSIASLDFLAEDHAGRVRHSTASAIWHRNPGAAAGIEWQLQSMPRSALALKDALLIDPSGQNDNVCGFSVSHKTAGGEHEPIWKYMSKHPEDVKKFASLMQVVAMKSGPGVILGLHDWSDMQGRLLVDCGGSTGHISAAIANKYPEVNIVVQDIPKVIEQAKAGRANGTLSIPQNISFEAQDFFQPQPLVADAYLYRQVLLNHSDNSVRKIIEALVPALRDGSRIFVIERVLPVHGSVPRYEELQARRMDATMNTLMNGKLRDLDEHKILFASIEPRLKLRKVTHGRGSTPTDPKSHSLLEWVFEDQEAPKTPTTPASPIENGSPPEFL